MRKVPPPMRNTVTSRTGLRPTLSPKCPKMMAPRGRVTNATANVPKDWSSATVGEASGKKTRGNTSAAAVPKIQKSYHSRNAPENAAIVARREVTGAGGADSGRERGDVIVGLPSSRASPRSGATRRGDARRPRSPGR